MPEPVTCHKCGYKWETKSVFLLVSCPYCGAKVRRAPLKAGGPDGEKRA